MIYKTIPLALNIATDFARVEKAAHYYSDGKFYVEIYNNGTCVFPHVSIDNKLVSGLEHLTKLCETPIDFTVKEMDDQNYIVRFTESVFSIVFGDQFRDQEVEIVRQAANDVSDEVVIGRHNSPQQHILIGLYARTRLMQDIQNPILVKSIIPDL
jgi:hypothetical protein